MDEPLAGLGVLAAEKMRNTSQVKTEGFGILREPHLRAVCGCSMFHETPLLTITPRRTLSGYYDNSNFCSSPGNIEASYVVYTQREGDAFIGLLPKGCQWCSKEMFVR